MRLLQIILLSVVGLTTATPFLIDSVNQEIDVQELSSSDLQKRATFPSASGLKFNIDGSTSYYAGTNSYWIGFLTSNADVDTVMSHLKSSGLKVLRVWGMSFPSPSSIH